MSKWISVRERLPEPFKEVEVIQRKVGGNLSEEIGYFDLRKLHGAYKKVQTRERCRRSVEQESEQ